ncbi:hypothetical protein ACXZ65_34320 [Streptomyces aculeolatus]
MRTPEEFRKSHGSPDGWSGDEIDIYLDLRPEGSSEQPGPGRADDAAPGASSPTSAGGAR